ncbi:MaoC family dehydratase [Ruegeria sediminis]|uniref:MaoC family dehydratase n=1 Tax=Ruegeria sediminis TaxID=2583820 RepID=A0ABY2X1Q8_9RHOB|nr:MaoC family dehydratase [Ruegeria sediminis]TMV09170.1 MaoC family dehydratase [Ruegeria sediminis]
MSALDNALAAAQENLGVEVGVSDWITVSQHMIDEFARVTLDDQWIHVDPSRAAAETPFGGSIAHGFLTLSLASRMFYDCFDPLPGQAMGINYGFDKLRFLAPVRSGARIRGRFVLSKVRKRSETELLRVHDLTVEIENQNTPALVTSWLGLTIFDL